MVICLMGPTACGKTDTAIQLAERYPCDIVSVDSAMVYRGMDIGTAKPTHDELSRAPHRLIDIRDPAEPYSVGEFCRDAIKEINDILSKGRLPLLVGGTMMYFHQLKMGYSALPSTTSNIRQQIQEEGAAIGWPSMHEKLITLDPDMAKQLAPNDAQRIARALEIYRQTGKTLSQWHAEQRHHGPAFDYRYCILAPKERSIIHERIEKRFDLMLKAGFLEEAKALHDRKDLHPELPAIRSVGYRQAWRYFDGEYDLATMREKAIVATRQLCKRQFTWLRRFEEASWYHSPDDLLSNFSLEP